MYSSSSYSVLVTQESRCFEPNSPIFKFQGEPQWFVLLFPHVLWPAGNIAITASVLMVVAVSTERYLAICRPLQYKPSPSFYVLFVLLVAVTVNSGRFLEYTLVERPHPDGGNATVYMYDYSDFMRDSRYVRLSRYWNEISVIGLAPLFALSILNYRIYAQIRSSTKFRMQKATVKETQSVLTPQHQQQQQTSASSSSSGERSTKLLVGIVFVFFVCHAFRLVLQFDAVIHPSLLGGKHFDFCIHRLGRFPSPVVFWQVS